MGEKTWNKGTNNELSVGISGDTLYIVTSGIGSIIESEQAVEIAALLAELAKVADDLKKTAELQSLDDKRARLKQLQDEIAVIEGRV